MVFVILPVYTTIVDFKLTSQYVIEVQAFGFNSEGFNKKFTLNI